MKVIARIYTEFSEKFGVPRQSGLIEELEGKIVFEQPYRFAQALRGLEEFSHLWLIWEFSENDEKPFSPTVRPPRLGGNKRLGVFATRSPFRPNRLGLSSVKIKHIDYDCAQAPVITVCGADMVSGTPIFDIKPYVESDVHTDAIFGFTQKVPFKKTTVLISDALAAKAGEHLNALIKVLENRPVPAYQNDPERIYGMNFAGKTVKFQISDDTLTVTDILDGS